MGTGNLVKSGHEVAPAVLVTPRGVTPGGRVQMQSHRITLSPSPSAEAWWPRFVEKIEVAENGCWLWTRRLDKEGYGHVSINRRNWLVHRAAYVALIGPIAPGMTLDHLCHTNARDCPGGRSCLHRRCANPWHCEPASNVENVMRGNSVPAQRARQTTCKKGHPLSGSNLLINGVWRRCKTCTYAYIQDRRSRKRASKPSASQLRVLAVLASGGSLRSIEFSHLTLCAPTTGAPICRVSRSTPAWLRRRGWLSDDGTLTDAGNSALRQYGEGAA